MDELNKQLRREAGEAPEDMESDGGDIMDMPGMRMERYADDDGEPDNLMYE